MAILVALTVWAMVVVSAWQMPPRPFPHVLPQPLHPTSSHSHPGVQNCTQRWYQQPIDHFGYGPVNNDPTGPQTFQQRYFVCLENTWSAGKPIFFYTGNEANVELYINASGLMWETAPAYGAMLIFAEHRFFGESLPFGFHVHPKLPDINYLSSEQALADYSTLLTYLRKNDPRMKTSAVIGFGGSYGGMLCSWLRMKYPASIDGCIAGSAPILSFMGMEPPYNSNSFAQTETRDASLAGGATDLCKENVRKGWPILQEAGSTPQGRTDLKYWFHLCDPLESTADVWALQYWLKDSWDYMAMGSYPYPSSYILNGHGTLPAYPLRVGCNFLNKNFGTDSTALLVALRQAADVFYNYSKTESCFTLHRIGNNETTRDNMLWNYLYCTELFQPFGQDGVSDMFWSSPWNPEASAKVCKSTWGVDTRMDWGAVGYGGLKAVAATSRIAFSNGGLDPWRGGGVLQAPTSEVSIIEIPDVGHHMDLMFSDPRDPPQILAARAKERELIGQWVKAASEERARDAA